MSSSIALNINPLFNIPFANHFTHSVSSISILLIACFIVQDPFSLSVLFTFAFVSLSSGVRHISPNCVETQKTLSSQSNVKEEETLNCTTNLWQSKQYVQFSSVQSLSRVCLCDPMNCSTPGLPVHHQLLEFTKPMSVESVMPSSHLILCRPLLLLPSIPPSITVFSNESTLCMRWPKYWSFSLSISPSNEYSGLISFRMD